MTFEPLTPERRRAMTRRHLLDAAAIVFAEKGFHGATIDEVAKAAGFTKGAVYSNFTSKDDLFLALLDDRSDRQFAVVTEVLDEGPRGRENQAPRMRELIQSGAIFSDDTWETLFLEFVLYARRNPEASEKLIARAKREREFVRQLIESEYEANGVSAKYSTRELAEISLDLFAGLSISRLINHEAVTEATLDTTMSLLWDSLGVDGDAERPGESVRRPT